MSRRPKRKAAASSSYSTSSSSSSSSSAKAPSVVIQLLEKLSGKPFPEVVHENTKWVVCEPGAEYKVSVRIADPVRQYHLVTIRIDNVQVDYKTMLAADYVSDGATSGNFIYAYKFAPPVIRPSSSWLPRLSWQMFSETVGRVEVELAPRTWEGKTVPVVQSNSNEMHAGTFVGDVPAGEKCGTLTTQFGSKQGVPPHMASTTAYITQPAGDTIRGVVRYDTARGLFNRRIISEEEFRRLDPVGAAEVQSAENADASVFSSPSGSSSSSRSASHGPGSEYKTPGDSKERFEGPPRPMVPVAPGGPRVQPPAEPAPDAPPPRDSGSKQNLIVVLLSIIVFLLLVNVLTMIFNPALFAETMKM